MKAGNKIRVQFYCYGKPSGTEDFIVEEFRYCLGIFLTDEDRAAGNFKPLCDLYYDGPDSKQEYISNYGEYRANQVPAWMNLPD